MSKSFRHNPVKGEIIENHLKDFKLSALNIKQMRGIFEQEVIQMIKMANDYFEANQQAIQFVNDYVIQNAITCKKDGTIVINEKELAENKKTMTESKRLTNNLKYAMEGKVIFFAGHLHKIYIKQQ